jgi:hypothetical protein
MAAASLFDGALLRLYPVFLEQARQCQFIVVSGTDFVQLVIIPLPVQRSM